MPVLLVFIGGGVGALARYGLTLFISGHAQAAIPLGTLVENLLGCLLIGLIFGLIEHALVPGQLRYLAITGFIGAFTTFSTYALETMSLVGRRHYLAAAFNFVTHNLFGFIAVAAGLALADAIRMQFAGR